MSGNAWKTNNQNIVDLLCTATATIGFAARVRRLQLTPELEKKVLICHEHSKCCRNLSEVDGSLTSEDEDELATKVLFYRHRFTQCVLNSQMFRQAALTVVQNIYLFRNRHIFFQPPTENGAEERIMALKLFGSDENGDRLTVAQSLRHPILARIWSRIVALSDDDICRQPRFLLLNSIVENLNTLRNIYVLFSSRLILKLAGRINPVYRQSLPYEDRVQVGTFGIARAAYRYHPSCGTRFSTYAANWFYKEIQRQALSGRLVRISSNMVERYAQANKRENLQMETVSLPQLSDAAFDLDEDNLQHCDVDNRLGHEHKIEEREQIEILLTSIDQKLSHRSGDIIRRRYGLAPYLNIPQSIIEIAEEYKMTRGRIYQIEQQALAILRKSVVKHNRISVYN
jgi:RNA polymerase sigma factor (sigma-70 family)